MPKGGSSKPKRQAKGKDSGKEKGKGNGKGKGKDQDSLNHVKVTFANRSPSGGMVDIVHVPSDGVEHKFRTLAAGMQFVIRSYPGHIFKARCIKGRTLDDTQTFEVTAALG